MQRWIRKVTLSIFDKLWYGTVRCGAVRYGDASEINSIEKSKFTDAKKQLGKKANTYRKALNPSAAP